MANDEIIYTARGRRIFQRFGSNDQVERSIRSQQSQSLSGLILVAIPLLVALVINPRKSLELFVSIVAVVIVFFGYLVIWRHLLRVTITSESLTLSHIGKHQRINRSEIAQVVSVMSMEYGKNYEEAPDRAILIIDRSRQTMCKFEQRAWGPEALKQIAAHLGGTSHSSSSPQPLAKLRKIYPGSYSWARAHVVITTLLAIGFGAIALIIAANIF